MSPITSQVSQNLALHPTPGWIRYRDVPKGGLSFNRVLDDQDNGRPSSLYKGYFVPSIASPTTPHVHPTFQGCFGCMLHTLRGGIQGEILLAVVIFGRLGEEIHRMEEADELFARELAIDICSRREGIISG